MESSMARPTRLSSGQVRVGEWSGCCLAPATIQLFEGMLPAGLWPEGYCPAGQQVPVCSATVHGLGPSCIAPRLWSQAFRSCVCVSTGSFELK